MHTRLLKYIFTITIFIAPFIANAQYNYKARKCFGYQRDSCSRADSLGYKIQEKSRSALFVKGQSSKTYLNLTNGRDYRISLCWDNLLGNKIIFKIVDAETENVLYDNSTDEFATEFEFTVTQTRQAFIEITVPGESGLSRNDSNNDIVIIRKDRSMGCVGVLIEHMITPVKGF